MKTKKIVIFGIIACAVLGLLVLTPLAKYLQASLFVLGIPLCGDENRGSGDPKNNPFNYDILTFRYELTHENMSAGGYRVKLIGDKNTLVTGGYYLENIDTETFKFYEGQETEDGITVRGGYAYDNSNIYYVEQGIIVMGGEYIKETPQNIVIGSKGDNIEVINNNYAILNELLYYHDTKVSDITVSEINALDDPRYVTDGMNIFYNGELFEFAKYEGFALVIDEYTFYADTLYSYNDVSIFYGAERVGDRQSTEIPVLASSLESADYPNENDPSLYLLDGNYGYYNGVYMGKVDKESFQVYSYKVSRDKFRYFCGETAVPYSIGDALPGIYWYYLDKTTTVDLYYPDCKAASIFRFICNDGELVSFDPGNLQAVGVNLTYGYDGNVISHSCTPK